MPLIFDQQKFDKIDIYNTFFKEYNKGFPYTQKSR